MHGQRLLYIVIVHRSPRLFVYRSHRLETVFQTQSNALKSWATYNIFSYVCLRCRVILFHFFEACVCGRLYIQTDGQTYRQTGRHTDRQTDT